MLQSFLKNRLLKLINIMKKIIFALIIVFTQTMLFVGSSISQSGWNLVYTASQTLNSVHFVNASTGYAVGMSGVVIKTTDGGNNWLKKTCCFS